MEARQEPGGGVEANGGLAQQRLRHQLLDSARQVRFRVDVI